MLLTKCDSCGTMIEGDSSKKHIHYYFNYDLCDDCYGKLVGNLNDELHKQGNDMHDYLENQKAVVDKLVKSKKK